MFSLSLTARQLERLTGGLLIVLALAFSAVFTVLQSRFGYPDVLDYSAQQVLPQLLAGGASLRLTWLVYALLPLLLVPITALLVQRFGQASKGLRQALMSTAALATLALMLGLIRWPSLHWLLAEQLAHGEVSPSSIALLFDAANVYLGTFVGELLGEILLYAWIGLAAVLAAKRLPRWLSVALLLTAVSGEVGAWRPFSEVAQVVADVNNLLLPLALLGLGVGLVLPPSRSRFVPQVQPNQATPKHSVAMLAIALGVSFASLSGQDSPSRLTGHELSVVGFRNPSTGVEYRWNRVSAHVGFYPTILATGSNGEDQDNSFYRFGASYWFLPFGKQGTPSAFYVSASYLTRSNTTVRIRQAALFDVGVRWVVWRGLALRLGVSTTAADNGLWYVNPMPGISYSFKLR